MGWPDVLQGRRRLNAYSFGLIGHHNNNMGKSRQLSCEPIFRACALLYFVLVGICGGAPLGKHQYDISATLWSAKGLFNTTLRGGILINRFVQKNSPKDNISRPNTEYRDSGCTKNPDSNASHSHGQSTDYCLTAT